MKSEREIVDEATKLVEKERMDELAKALEEGKISIEPIVPIEEDAAEEKIPEVIGKEDFESPK